MTTEPCPVGTVCPQCSRTVLRIYRKGSNWEFYHGTVASPYGNGTVIPDVCRMTDIERQHYENPKLKMVRAGDHAICSVLSMLKDCPVCGARLNHVTFAPYESNEDEAQPSTEILYTFHHRWKLQLKPGIMGMHEIAGKTAAGGDLTKEHIQAAIDSIAKLDRPEYLKNVNAVAEDIKEVLDVQTPFPLRRICQISRTKFMRDYGMAGSQ